MIFTRLLFARIVVENGRIKTGQITTSKVFGHLQFNPVFGHHSSCDQHGNQHDNHHCLGNFWQKPKKITPFNYALGLHLITDIGSCLRQSTIQSGGNLAEWMQNCTKLDQIKRLIFRAHLIVGEPVSKVTSASQYRVRRAPYLWNLS